MSTTIAPMMAHDNFDPMPDATARAAAKAGMTVEQWIAYTDQLGAAERSRRVTDQLMRQVPRYRDEDAA